MSTGHEREHLEDPADDCDSYVLLDDGEALITSCDECDRAVLVDDIPEGMEMYAHRNWARWSWMEREKTA